MVLGGVVAGLAAVLLYAVSTVLQVVAARRAAGVQVGLDARDLIASPLWWLALGLLSLAFLAFVASTRVLPLPAAEALRSSYLAVAVVLGHAVFRTRPRPRETVGVALSLVGLVLFLAGGGQRGDCAPPSALPVTMAVVLIGVVVSDAVLERYGRLGPRAWGAIEALLAGLAFAMLDLGVRSLPDPLTVNGVMSLPAAWIGAVAAPIGLLLFSRASTRTSVAVATTLMLVVNVVAAAAGAAVAFCDSLSGGPVLLISAVASMLVGTALVASGVPAPGSTGATDATDGTTQTEAGSDRR